MKQNTPILFVPGVYITETMKDFILNCLKPDIK